MRPDVVLMWSFVVMVLVILAAFILCLLGLLLQEIRDFIRRW